MLEVNMSQPCDLKVLTCQVRNSSTLVIIHFYLSFDFVENRCYLCEKMLLRWKPVKNHVNQVEGGLSRESTSVAEMGVTAPESKGEGGDY